MKMEISIEEKAQRYDEAINRMKHYVVDEYGCSRIKVADVFPELKESEEESEDERIRKALIDWFSDKHAADDFGGIAWERIVAWLNKQGKKEEEILVLKDQIESLHAAIKALKEVHIIELEKQEWSEEDEKKRTLLIRILEVNHPNGYFKVNPANTLNMEAMHTDELVSWLKSLKERYAWKPSDEQMEALEHFIIHHNGSTNYAKDLEELRLQLKKLREE